MIDAKWLSSFGAGILIGLFIFNAGLIALIWLVIWKKRRSERFIFCFKNKYKDFWKLVAACNEGEAWHLLARSNQSTIAGIRSYFELEDVVTVSQQSGELLWFDFDTREIGFGDEDEEDQDGEGGEGFANGWAGDEEFV